MIRRAWLLWPMLLMLLAGCGEPVHRQQAYVFGTLVEVVIHGEDAATARRVTDQILLDFDQMHRTLHAWQPGSLDRVNAILALASPDKPARAALPPGFIPIFEDLARLEAQSEGLFNPAIGNLVRLWGFHADEFRPHRPAQEEIERLVAARPSLADIELDGVEFVGRNPAVRLDLGGYAKGHALDVAAAYLKGQGVDNALINIGGNVLALGRHGKRPWRVGIQHPRRPGAIAEIDLADGEAIGTSGDYQRYFELDGRRYSHLIDPRSGWPAQGTQAVTVLTRGAGAGVLSDVASKPMFIAGAAHWQRLAERMGVREAMRIDADGRVELTAALAARLRWQGEPPPHAVID